MKRIKKKMKLEVSEQEVLEVFQGRWEKEHKGWAWAAVVAVVIILILGIAIGVILEDKVSIWLFIPIYLILVSPLPYIGAHSVNMAREYAKSQLAEFKAQEHETPQSSPKGKGGAYVKG